MPRRRKNRKLSKLHLPNQEGIPLGQLGYTGNEEYEALQQLYANLSPEDREQFDSMLEANMSEGLDNAFNSIDPEELKRMKAVLGDQVETPEFWDNAVWTGVMWEMLKTKLEPDEVDLLQRVFGDEWETLGMINDEWMASHLLLMTDHERNSLYNIMSKLNQMQAEIEQLAQLQEQKQAFTMQQQQQYDRQQSSSSASPSSYTEVMHDGDLHIVQDGSGPDPQDPPQDPEAAAAATASAGIGESPDMSDMNARVARSVAVPGVVGVGLAGRISVILTAKLCRLLLASMADV